MTDKDLEYYKQLDFRGGICTQAEDAKANQVLMAENAWSPYSIYERRPGVVSQIIGDPFGTPSINLQSLNNALIPSHISHIYEMTPAGVITEIPGGLSYDLSNITQKSRIIITCDTVLGNGLRPDSPFALKLIFNTPSTTNSNKSTFTLEVLTARGYMPIQCFSYPRYFLQANDSDGTHAYQYFWFSVPQDTITDYSVANLPNLSSGVGFVFRFAITSADLSSNVKLDDAIFSGAGTLWQRNFNRSSQELNVISRLQFSNCTKFITISTADYSLTNNPNPSLNLTAPPFVTYGMFDSIGFIPQLNPMAGEFAFVGSTQIPTQNFTFRFVQRPKAKSPTIAVIPQIGYAFCAYQNTITQHYVNPTFLPFAGTLPFYGPATSNPYYNATNNINSGPNQQAQYAGAIIAPVNNDPAITGPTDISQGQIGLWPKDTVIQDPVWPAANILIYHSNTLFAMDIQGNPQAIKWTTDVNSGGWNVWPSTSVAYLSTPEDNSGITGAAVMGDNLVVFKANSIWTLIPNGTDENNLVLYEARRVVTGVGTASHQSIQATPQGLIFLAEDGFYIFDGTPNVQRISGNIQALIDNITPTGKSLANAVVWRTKQYYLCAVQVHNIAATDDVNTPQNNAVFAYNYKSGAWDYWTGWNVTCWLQQNGLGGLEELWYFDRRGRGYKLGIGSTDDGAQFEPMILTNRFGINEVNSEGSAEFRVVGINNNGQLSASLIYDDIEDFVEKSIEMPLTGTLETKYADNPAYNQVPYAPERRRARTKGTPMVSGKWFQVRLKNFNKLFRLALGVHDEGNRP